MKSWLSINCLLLIVGRFLLIRFDSIRFQFDRQGGNQSTQLITDKRNGRICSTYKKESQEYVPSQINTIADFQSSRSRRIVSEWPHCRCRRHRRRPQQRNVCQVKSIGMNNRGMRIISTAIQLPLTPSMAMTLSVARWSIRVWRRVE